MICLYILTQNFARPFPNFTVNGAKFGFNEVSFRKRAAISEIQNKLVEDL